MGSLATAPPTGGVNREVNSNDESRLVERARRGDTEAFEALISQYEKRVYGLAFRLTGNHEDASDMAQEAFVRVYMSLPDFRGDSSFGTWLTRIVHNACKDELRRRRRQRVSSLDEPMDKDDGEMSRQWADPADGPEQAFERTELRRLVRETVLSLDEDHRDILILRDFQDLTYEQIRDVLGLSLGTVKSRLNRARAALREALRSRLGDRELLSPPGVYKTRRRRGSEV